MKAEFKRVDEKYVVATIPVGKYQHCPAFRVYGLPDEWVGCPGVCIAGDISNEMLTPEQAEQLAVALVRAAKASRGQTSTTIPADAPNNVVALR